MKKSIRSGKERVWMQYVNDIIACDVPSAVFLSTYLRQAERNHSTATYHEVVDLQRYKMVRSPKKVSSIMHSKLTPFVFVINKN
ncbi:MAG: hypothetical protein ABI378_02485 [Chitinophagaceae bacterium]